MLFQHAKDQFLEEHAALPAGEAEKGGEAAFMERLQKIEEHIRNNKLRVNLTDKIGAAAKEKEDISNTNEAKKLAFYIFWNVKASHDVYVPEAVQLHEGWQGCEFLGML
jgi:hypothetical protein